MGEQCGWISFERLFTRCCVFLHWFLPCCLPTEVVQKVNKMIAAGQYGRLFAVVHFASKQWKITSEDLIMMDNVLEAECGDRIRMEKVMCHASTVLVIPCCVWDQSKLPANISWGKTHNQFLKKCPKELLLDLLFLLQLFALHYFCSNFSYSIHDNIIAISVEQGWNESWQTLSGDVFLLY